jgi:hypothetical protein
MKIKLLITIGIFAILFSCKEKEIELNGQVFIVTQGGQSIPLGLVSIGLMDLELANEVLKERLKLLDERSDFHIEYNTILENTIKHYLKNRRKSFERLLGISQFYFPMYENALSAYNIPLEIKYLSIVESALNPKAVSRVGATGLWQFMFYTGK